MEQFANSNAFVIFAAFVALNTLVYIGLTLSRLIPWPRPLELTLARERIDAARDDDVEGLRQVISDQMTGVSGVAQVARGLLWLGLVGFAVAAVESFSGAGRTAELVAAVIGVCCLAASLAVRRRRVTLTAATWLWASAIAVADVGLMIQAGSTGDGFRYSFAIVIMAGFGTLCFAYLPFFVSVGIQIVALGACLVVWPTAGSLQWMIAAFTAAVAGTFMVGQRREADGQLARILAASESLGLRHAGTGSLNLQGLKVLGGPLADLAWHEGRAPMITTIQVDGVDALAMAYDRAFVTRLNEAVSDALAAYAADGDLVADIAPGTICLVSWHHEPNSQAIVLEVKARVDALSLGKSPMTVRGWSTAARREGAATWPEVLHRALLRPQSADGAGPIPT